MEFLTLGFEHGFYMGITSIGLCWCIGKLFNLFIGLVRI